MLGLCEKLSIPADRELFKNSAPGRGFHASLSCPATGRHAQAVMRKEGARLIIELKPARSLLPFCRVLSQFRDFAPVADLPAQAGRPVMRYLLDTSICPTWSEPSRDRWRRRPGGWAERQVCTSIIVASG